MTLLLHCGYHKTASSYLQSCFAACKELLFKNGIHYPDDPNQAKAAKGIPTAGNGILLCQAVLQEKKEAARKYLRRYIAEAQSLGAKAVMLSAEGFFTAFTRPEAVKLFAEVIKEARFDAVRAIMFFRDPVEHAISVYCHRAASGTMPPFVPWLESTFETPERMEKLPDFLNELPIEWTFRKFQPKKQNIVETVMHDWLQITDALDLSTVPSMVNVSVSIAESELLAQLGKTFPKCGRYVSAALKKLPKQYKADESELRLYYEAHAAHYFNKRVAMLERINALLPGKEKLVIKGTADLTSEFTRVPRPLFTSDQLVASGAGMLEFMKSRSPQGRLLRFVNRAKEQFKRHFD